MSTLSHLYRQEGPNLLDRLAVATGANRKYLYQLATGRRRPSPELARDLAAADERMTVDELLFGDPDDPKGRTASSRRRLFPGSDGDATSRPVTAACVATKPAAARQGT